MRLQELRNKKGISQAEAARRLHVSKGTISSYERNLKVPKQEKLIALAILYNASVDYILGLTDRPCIYLDDLTEEHQLILLKTLQTLKEELQKSESAKKSDG